MRRLDELDIEDLTDDWIFFSLSNFISDVEHGCFMDYDGYGEFIYIDKNGIMYTKENECFCPSEIVKIINFVYKNNKMASCIDVAKALREKYSNSDYKLFAIFWYNK